MDIFQPKVVLRDCYVFNETSLDIPPKHEEVERIRRRRREGHREMDLPAAKVRRMASPVAEVELVDTAEGRAKLRTEEEVEGFESVRIKNEGDDQEEYFIPSGEDSSNDGGDARDPPMVTDEELRHMLESTSPSPSSSSSWSSPSTCPHPKNSPSRNTRHSKSDSDVEEVASYLSRKEEAGPLEAGSNEASFRQSSAKSNAINVIIISSSSDSETDADDYAPPMKRRSPSS